MPEVSRGYPPGSAALVIETRNSFAKTPVTGERSDPVDAAMETEKQMERNVIFFFHCGQFWT
jgi:hypothetical protein